MFGIRTKYRENEKNAFKMHTLSNKAKTIYKYFIEIAKGEHWVKCFQEAKEI